MVQVLTVSANTAAYVAEAMKTPPRVSRAKFVEENRQTVDKDAPPEDTYTAQIAATVSDSTSSALNFMTAGQQRKRGTTLKETIDAYESF